MVIATEREYLYLRIRRSISVQCSTILRCPTVGIYEGQQMTDGDLESSLF